MIFLTIKIILLLALPVVALLISRSKYSGHVGLVTGAVLGMVIVPFSHILTVYFGLFHSFYHIISLPMHWISTMMGYSYFYQLIANSIVWGVLFALYGYFLDKIFQRGSEYNEFASVEEKLRSLGLQSVSVFSEKGLSIYERVKLPLKDKNEAIAKELVIASHNTDKAKARTIGKQLNSSGGIDRMKLLCYRVRHLGGDDQWLEIIWSGIGKWEG